MTELITDIKETQTIYKPRPYQEEAIQAGIEFFKSKEKKNGIIIAPTGSGKCYRKGTEIIMSDYNLKKVEDIIPGECVLGVNGQSIPVVELCRGREKFYEIKPVKGDSFFCNESHILSLVCNAHNCRYEYGEIVNIPVKEYIHLPKSVKHVLKLYRTGVEMDYQRYPVNPYFVGLWLAEGNKTKGQHCFLTINADDTEVLDYLKRSGATWMWKYPDRNCYKVSFNKKGVHKRGIPNPIEQELRKFVFNHQDVGITKQYLHNNRKTRLQLLAGLIDGDGHLSESNHLEIATKFPRLRDDILFLCRSLGLAAYSIDKIVKDKTYYRISISGDLSIIPNKLTRKKGTPRKQIKDVLRTGFSVTELPEEDYYGFSLEGNDKRHLLKDFTVVHNSVLISEMAYRLNEPIIVLQPSKEILEQNYEKLQSYGILDIGIFSASLGQKKINRITLATIGSVYNRKEEFRHFNYVLADECHLINPTQGMYKHFFNTIQCKVIGLTATPIRLGNNSYGSILKFLTRCSPRVFSDVIHCTQIGELKKQGYLADMEYFTIGGFNSDSLKVNSTGSGYTDESIKAYYKEIMFNNQLLKVLNRLIEINRKHILVFTQFVEEARTVMEAINLQCGEGTAALVTGETPKAEREELLRKFKSGLIKVMCNCGVLTTGFDFPALDTVVMARPTRSLSLYYQIFGRPIRPHHSKTKAWCIDLCDNFKKFGKVEDLVMTQNEKGLWVIKNGNKQLTNVYF